MVAKIGGVSSLFNISEPIMFELPVVYNPIYAISFCIVPIPWVTPPIISGWLSTGDFRGALVQIVILIVGVAIYTPFVIVSNKSVEK